MWAALHGSFVDFVVYVGSTERYPDWFNEHVLDDIYMDSHRFTFWMPKEERPVDYYEKDLVESDSVFLRKQSDGEIFCTNYQVFKDLYKVFIWEDYANHGVAAFEEDCIEYVECVPGVLSDGYPDWFYEYFTESVHFPQQEESIFFYDIDIVRPTISSSSMEILTPLNSSTGQISVNTHCVFLRNVIGEIRHMDYDTFLEHYDPGPVPFVSYGSLNWLK